MVRHEVENQVVLLSTFREIISGVINDVICAEGSDHFNVPRTANARNFRAERLGDLHSEGTHPSCRTVYQDLLLRLNLSFVPKALQGSESRQRDRSHLLKQRVIRFHDQCRLGSTRILGKGPTAQAEHRVARLELGYEASNRFDLTSHITPGPIALSFAQRRQYAELLCGARHSMLN